MPGVAKTAGLIECACVRVVYSGCGVGGGPARGGPGGRQSSLQPTLRRDRRQGQTGHQRRYDVCRHRAGRSRRLPGAPSLQRSLSLSLYSLTQLIADSLYLFVKKVTAITARIRQCTLVMFTVNRLTENFRLTGSSINRTETGNMATALSEIVITPMKQSDNYITQLKLKHNLQDNNEIKNSCQVKQREHKNTHYASYVQC